MAERPWSNLARINSRCASQTLRQARRGCRAQNSATTGGRPLAGTGICPSDPVGALAGFASANRTYRETVPRSMCSSRAIRRNDQRCACSCNTACTIAILRRFDIPGLLPHEVCKEGPTSNLAPLNMAAFQALNAGGFLAPNDSTPCVESPNRRHGDPHIRLQHWLFEHGYSVADIKELFRLKGWRYTSPSPAPAVRSRSPRAARQRQQSEKINWLK